MPNDAGGGRAAGLLTSAHYRELLYNCLWYGRILFQVFTDSKDAEGRLHKLAG